MKDVILDIKNVHVFTGKKKILDNISLTIENKKIYGIFGPSGVGKSTLFYTLLGLLDQKVFNIDGEITYYQGPNLIGLEEKEVQQIIKKYVGVMFQQSMEALDPYQTVGQSIFQTLQLKEIKPSLDIALEYITLAGLGKEKGILNKYPYELSGGMAQKVCLALALIGNPKLLLADEPTSSMDAIYVKDFVQFLRKLSKQRDGAILFISHDLALLTQFCDKLIIMDQGQIIEFGDVSYVIEHPKTQQGKKQIEESKKIYG